MFGPDIFEAIKDAEDLCVRVTASLRTFNATGYPTDIGLASLALRACGMLHGKVLDIQAELLTASEKSIGARCRELEGRSAKSQDFLRCDWDRCARAATHKGFHEDGAHSFCCASHAEHFRDTTPLLVLEAIAAARTLEVKP
jgi:hypothetical protein